MVVENTEATAASQEKTADHQRTAETFGQRSEPAATSETSKGVPQVTTDKSDDIIHEALCLYDAGLNVFPIVQGKKRLTVRMAY